MYKGTSISKTFKTFPKLLILFRNLLYTNILRIQIIHPIRRSIPILVYHFNNIVKHRESCVAKQNSK